MKIANMQAQCDTATHLVCRLEIQPDNYPNELSWLFSSSDGTTLANGAVAPDIVQVHDFCFPKSSGCITFRINDNYGDGILSPGYYKLWVNDVLVATDSNFGYTDSYSYNCPPGSNCTSALPVTEGDWVAPQAETWYTFTPDSTGAYLLASCYDFTTCFPSIWIYDDCSNLIITDGVQGALYFSSTGCEIAGPALSANLVAGTPYIIRIGDGTANSCGTGSIGWQLTFKGPIVGCTDPTACNYNPLATIADTSCIYPGSPQCTGPDLVIVEAELLNSLYVSNYNADIDNCAVVEGCVNGYGQREVLNFGMHIRNIGNLDYYVGAPPSDINTPSSVFEYSNCHGHWHYKHYGKYSVFDKDGVELPLGQKNGYCVIDLECDGGGNAMYSCGNMGIAAGCGDIYGVGTTCQWMDITDLDTGRYMMVAQVNWLQQVDANGFHESNYNNNAVRFCFQLNRNAAGTASIQVLGDCNQFVDCTGVLFGGAQPDCAGTCAGILLAGDVTDDTLRTVADTKQYLIESVLDTITPVKCTDLNDDGKINVVDAALLQECAKHGDDLDYWGNGFPCVFPTGMFNPNQIVILNAGDINPTEQYIDIDILNPLCRVLGFEFKLNGIGTITNVESLLPSYNPEIAWSADGQISGIDTSEVYIDKQYNPLPFLRVYYTNSDNVICIDTAATFVNDKYEEVDKVIGENCQTITNTNTIDRSAKLVAIPNPFSNTLRLFFPNEYQEVFQIEMLNNLGEVIKSYPNLRGNEIILDTNNLSSGIYYIRLMSGSKTYTTKVVK